MTERVAEKVYPHGRRMLFSVAMIAAGALMTASPMQAQTAADIATDAQPVSVSKPLPTPAEKLEFEVASVRQSAPDVSTRGKESLFPFDGSQPEGTLFSANVPLPLYIIFAYQIIDPSQYPALIAQLPKWVQGTQFDIEARAKETPTRDQLRRMLQSLLADRFKLAMHTETKQKPVYALVLEKADSPGPQLQPHSDKVPCVAIAGSRPSDSANRPVFCGADTWRTPGGQLHVRMVDVPMDQVAGLLSGMASFLAGMEGRPLVDQTGLKGRYDLDLEFTPQKPGWSPDSEFGNGGLTLVGALQKQLGLKLVKQTGPVSSLVIDHVEQPTAN